MILEKADKLKDADLAFISKASASKYVKRLLSTISFQKAIDQSSASPLRTKFSNIKENGLVDLLEGMLQFNPDLRMTAKECLQHTMFDDLRKKHQLVKNHKIQMPTYADGDFNYERNEQVGLQLDDLKSILAEEVKHFRPELTK